jgi:hypothetical protein
MSKPEPAAIEPSSGFADFVLRQLNVERIRARLALNHINTAIIALSGGLIDGETALAMLAEVSYRRWPVRPASGTIWKQHASHQFSTRITSPSPLGSGPPIRDCLHYEQTENQCPPDPFCQARQSGGSAQSFVPACRFSLAPAHSRREAL